MIRRVDLRGRVAAGEVLDLEAVNSLVPRALLDVEAALDVVRPICLDVRHRGLEAIREYGEKFDQVRVEDLRVPAEALKTALEELDPEVRSAFEESIRRVREVSEDERGADVESQPAPGGRVTQRLVPVQRVGLYVPGGGVTSPERGAVGWGRRQVRVRGVAAPDGGRGVRDARDRRGLRDGWRPG